MKKYKFQQGGFSDEFYSTISRLAQLRQQQDSQNEEYYVQPEEDNTDDRYSSLEEEIANLKEQISSFQQPQSQPQNENEDINPDSMAIINMVMNMDNSEDSYNNEPVFSEYEGSSAFDPNQQPLQQGLDWLPTKDKSVNIKGTSSKLTEYLNGLPPNVKASLLATSGNDSDTHVENSRHYRGEAVDFRYNDNVYNYMLNDPHLAESGLKILNPNHGTSKHIHIQTK